MNLTNIDILQKEFTGEIIMPNDSAYEQARSTFMVTGHPAIVLRPHNAQAVAKAIAYARDSSLLLSIRSGGHSGAGFSTNTDGVVIDLSAINTVEIIDVDKHIVRIGSGAKWGEVAKRLQEHNLALSSGDTISVGVGGLVVAGGIGWMVRKYGLAIDSLVAAEVVTAEGKILRVSTTENSDLFWAIRGGGGNFGVVTYFEFAAHPIGKIYSGTLFYSLDNLSGLLKGLRDYMRTADENLTTILNIIPSFGGNPPAAMLTCCYAGDDKEVAMKSIEPLKTLGNLQREDIKEKHYYEVLEEAHPPAGIKIITNNMFVEDFSDEVIAAITTAQSENPNFILQIRNLGGAMKRITPEATAFAYRNSEALIVCPTFVPPTASDDEIDTALKQWKTIAPFGKGGYANFFSEVNQNVSVIYPKTTYERLSTVKKMYDPKNIFNQNYNIKPKL